MSDVGQSAIVVAVARRPWVAPAVIALPPLQQLTLQTGGAINGDCTTSGCTFSLLPTLPSAERRFPG